MLFIFHNERVLDVCYKKRNDIVQFHLLNVCVALKGNNFFFSFIFICSFFCSIYLQLLPSDLNESPFFWSSKYDYKTV